MKSTIGVIVAAAALFIVAVIIPQQPLKPQPQRTILTPTETAALSTATPTGSYNTQRGLVAAPTQLPQASTVGSGVTIGESTNSGMQDFSLKPYASDETCIGTCLGWGYYYITIPEAYRFEHGGAVRVYAKDRITALSKVGPTVWTAEEWKDCEKMQICNQFNVTNEPKQ